MLKFVNTGHGRYDVLSDGKRIGTVRKAEGPYEIGRLRFAHRPRWYGQRTLGSPLFADGQGVSGPHWSRGAAADAVAAS